MTSAGFNTKLRQRVKDTNSNSYFFSEVEITNSRDRAIQWLYPRVYNNTVVDVPVTDLNKTGITMSSDIIRLMDIWVYDGTSYQGTYNAFKKIGSSLYPLDEFPTGKTFRLIVAKKFTTVEELGDEFEDVLLDRAQMELLKTMEHDRTKYYKYTTIIRPEGGNVPSLSRIIDRLNQNTLLRRLELANVPEASFINLTER